MPRPSSSSRAASQAADAARAIKREDGLPTAGPPRDRRDPRRFKKRTHPQDTEASDAPMRQTRAPDAHTLHRTASETHTGQFMGFAGSTDISCDWAQPLRSNSEGAAQETWATGSPKAKV